MEKVVCEYCVEPAFGLYLLCRTFHVAYAQLDYDKLVIALVLVFVLVFILGVSFSDLRYGKWE